jgi:integrase
MALGRRRTNYFQGTFEEYVNEKWSLIREGSESWHITQDHTLRLHILPLIGSIPFQEIQPEHITKVLKTSKDKGHRANTRMKAYSILSKLFQDALEHGHYEWETPVLRLHRPEADPDTKAAYLSAKEAQALAIASTGHWAENAVKVGLYLGLRYGEIAGLQWQDLNFQKATASIVRAWNRTTEKMDTPKNGEFSELAEYLAEVKRYRKPKPTDFVCLSAAGQMLSYHSFKKTLPILCGRARVQIITPHELRHTFAELLKTEAECSTEDIRIALGHKTVISTMAYLHDENSAHLGKKFARITLKKPRLSAVSA